MIKAQERAKSDKNEKKQKRNNKKEVKIFFLQCIARAFLYWIFLLLWWYFTAQESPVYMHMILIRSEPIELLFNNKMCRREREEKKKKGNNNWSELIPNHQQPTPARKENEPSFDVRLGRGGLGKKLYKSQQHNTRFIQIAFSYVTVQVSAYSVKTNNI